MDIVTHDVDAMRVFLQTLDQQAQKFVVQFIPDRKGAVVPPELRLPLNITIDEIVALVQNYNTAEMGLGVFFTPNETDGHGRKTENITRVRAVFGDFDKEVRQSIRKLKKNKLSPHLIVRTSKGRFHIYWLVRDLELKQFKKFQQAIACNFGGDPAVCDLPRLMRLPGSLHLKSNPYLVTAKISSNIDPYSCEKIITGLGLHNIEANYALLESPEAISRAELLRSKFEKSGDGGLLCRDSISFDDLTGEQRDMELKAMLEYISSIADGPRDRWFNMMMASKSSSAPSAKAIFREWSQGSEKYNEVSFERDWASIKTNRWKGVGIGSLIAEAMKVGYTLPWRRNNQNSPPTVLVKNFILTSPEPINLSLTPRHRKFIYGTKIIIHEVSILAAPGGKGKSASALAIAAALSAGKQLIYDVVFGGPKRVLFISTEDSRDELHRRLLALSSHYNLSQADIDGVLFVGAEASRLTLTSGTDKKPEINHQALDALSRMVREMEVDLLILDPLGPLVPIGLNDNGLMGQLILMLKQLACAANCGILLVHHFRKGSDGSAESISGASAIVNHARVAMTITAMSEQEGARVGVLPSELWRYFRITDAKTNYAPPATGEDWLKLETVVLNNPEPPTYQQGDGVQVVVPATFAAATSRGYLDQLEHNAVVADVVHLVRDASEPPYLKAVGRAKGKTTILDIISMSVRGITNRPSQDARRIAETLYVQFLAEGVLVEVDLMTPQRKYRRAVALGPKFCEVSSGAASV